MESFNKCWRLELFYKSTTELREKTIPFLKEHGVRRVNLTNKTKNDKLLESTTVLGEEIKTINVCVHYSIKWNYTGGVDATYDALKDFLQRLSSIKGRNSVMLVSGGGKKRKLDTVEALRRLRQEEKLSVPIHVAFNPYFPDEKDWKEERRRLKQKLETGLVSGIWLQTGSDLTKLDSGLEFLQASCSVPIYGSIFLPTKKLLAQMKYRPWNGVFLSDEYLSSVESATKLTKSLLECYRKYGVIPLLETALRSSQDMRNAAELLALGCQP